MCQQLLEDYEHAKVAKTSKGKRTREMDRREVCYQLLWLASLFAVAEGFRSMKLTDSKIDELSAQHWDSLRLLRNGTFHFQPAHNKQSQFFTDSESRMEWAKKMHDALRDYFSEYRVDFMVKQFMK
jgi:nicotinic acid phosphoribosyltransferase